MPLTTEPERADSVELFTHVQGIGRVLGDQNTWVVIAAISQVFGLNIWDLVHGLRNRRVGRVDAGPELPGEEQVAESPTIPVTGRADVRDHPPGARGSVDRCRSVGDGDSGDRVE